MKENTAGNKNGVATSETKTPAIFSIAIIDKNILFSTYMAYLTNGGLFIPTKKIFTMNQHVQLMLKLPDSEEKFLVNGEIVWLTPERAQNGRLPGIGVEFLESDGTKINKKIQQILGDMLNNVTPTHTM